VHKDRKGNGEWRVEHFDAGGSPIWKTSPAGSRPRRRRVKSEFRRVLVKVQGSASGRGSPLSHLAIPAPVVEQDLPVLGCPRRAVLGAQVIEHASASNKPRTVRNASICEIGSRPRAREGWGKVRRQPFPPCHANARLCRLRRGSQHACGPVDVAKQAPERRRNQRPR
jgi:hypothetical protein